MRTPDTTSSPWAFVRKSPLGSGAPVTSSREKATPEPEVVARVAEHHLLDVDRGAPVVRDAVDAPVGDGPLARPGVEDGQDRAPQLLARVAREVVEGAEAAGELAQRVDGEVGVETHAVFALDAGDLILEARAGHAADHIAEHLHQAAIGVPREPLVAGARGEPRDGAVVEPEVEDRVHHSRHRVARAAAHGDQQRVLRIREPLAGAVPRVVPAPRRRRRRAPPGHCGRVAHVGDARLGGDREAGGDELRAEHARHLRDVGALAAEQVAHLARPVREVVDPPGCGRCAHIRSSPVPAGCRGAGRAVGASPVPPVRTSGRIAVSRP